MSGHDPFPWTAHISDGAHKEAWVRDANGQTVWFRYGTSTKRHAIEAANAHITASAPHGLALADAVMKLNPNWVEIGAGKMAHLRELAERTMATAEAAEYPKARTVRLADQIDWSDLEDDLSDVISDSMDIDWTSRIGARAVVEYLKSIGGAK